MASDLGVSDARIGLLVSGYAAISALVTIPSVLITARLSRVNALLLSLVALFGSEVITAMATNYTALAASRVLAALVHGLFWSLVPPVAALLVPPARMGRATAAVFAGASLALVAGSPLTTLIGHALGWRQTAALVAIWTAATAIGLWLVLPASPKAAHTAESKASQDISDHRGVDWRAVTAICVICLVFVTAHYTTYTYLAVIVISILHGSGLLVTVLTVFGVAGSAGNFLVGMHNDRHPQGSAIASAATYLAGMLLLASTATTSAPVWRGVLLLAAMALCGSGYGAFGPASQAGIIRAAPARRELASSYYVAAFQVGIASGSGLGALLVDSSRDMLPSITAAVIAVAVAAVLVFRRAYSHAPLIPAGADPSLSTRDQPSISPV